MVVHKYKDIYIHIYKCTWCTSCTLTLFLYFLVLPRMNEENTFRFRFRDRNAIEFWKKKKKTNNVSINFWTSLGIILYIKIIMYTYIIYMNGTHIRMHRKREKKKVILFIFFETNTSSRNYALNDVNRLCRTRGFYVTLSKFDRWNEQWSVNFDIISFRSHYLHSIPSRFFFLFLSFLFLRKCYL